MEGIQKGGRWRVAAAAGTCWSVLGQTSGTVVGLAASQLSSEETSHIVSTEREKTSMRADSFPS